MTALRCCLVKRASPQNWSVLTAMERHQKEREGDEYYKVNQVSIINFYSINAKLLNFGRYIASNTV